MIRTVLLTRPDQIRDEVANIPKIILFDEITEENRALFTLSGTRELLAELEYLQRFFTENYSSAIRENND